MLQNMISVRAGPLARRALRLPFTASPLRVANPLARYSHLSRPPVLPRYQTPKITARSLPLQQRRSIFSLFKRNQQSGSCKLCDGARHFCNFFAETVRFPVTFSRAFWQFPVEAKFFLMSCTGVVGFMFWLTSCFGFYSLESHVNWLYLFPQKLALKGKSARDGALNWWYEVDDDESSSCAAMEVREENWMRSVIASKATLSCLLIRTRSERDAVAEQWLLETVAKYDAARRGRELYLSCQNSEHLRQNEVSFALTQIPSRYGWEDLDYSSDVSAIAKKYVEECLPREGEGAGMQGSNRHEKKDIQRAQETLVDLRRALKTRYFNEAIYGKKNLEPKNSPQSLDQDATLAMAAEIESLKKQLQQMEDKFEPSTSKIASLEEQIRKLENPQFTQAELHKYLNPDLKRQQDLLLWLQRRIQEDGGFTSEKIGSFALAFAKSKGWKESNVWSIISRCTDGERVEILASYIIELNKNRCLSEPRTITPAKGEEAARKKGWFWG